MKLNEILDIDKFHEFVREGYITIRKHEKEELVIANYTAKASYERIWTPETLQSRGLIYALDGSLEIKARPIKKFFNLSEPQPFVVNYNSPVEVTDKLDGSCGIYYLDSNGQPSIATRGSFSSEQAIWATTKIRTIDHTFPANLTPIFEIIYKQNRIVINYNYEDLVLLCGVDILTGTILGPNNPMLDGWNGRRTEVFEYRNIEEAVQAPPRNLEGYVFRFLDPKDGLQLLKLKEEEYVRLHGIITNFSPKKVWAAMSEGIDFLKVLDTVPDEFYELVHQIQTDLTFAYSEIEAQAKLDFHDLREFKTSRKKFAQKAVKKDNKSILFAMLDGKDYSKMIWKQLEPKEQNV